MKTLMRHKHYSIIPLLVMFSLAINLQTAVAKQEPQYRSAILIDAETGQVLFEKDAHKQVIPASVVKMMVLLLALEKIEADEIHLSDIVTVSAWASKIGGHQVYLAEGEQFQLVELLKAVSIGSANDAATAVAEYIAGDADACVDLMNARAKELGMMETTFANEHGLPPDKGQQENSTTAYDIALLGRELLKHPQILRWSSTVEDTFRNGTFTLTNTNRRLLQNYAGADGLKTGFHGRGAGFNVCATAQRRDLRLIAVVMGAERKTDRYRAAVNLFNYGFNSFKRVVVLRKGFSVGEPLPVEKGKETSTTLIASENAVILVKKGEEENIKQEIDIPVDYIIAPVKKGTRFGQATFSLGEQIITDVDLVTEDTLEKGSLFQQVTWWIFNKIF